jgi:hypothetical protein
MCVLHTLRLAQVLYLSTLRFPVLIVTIPRNHHNFTIFPFLASNATAAALRPRAFVSLADGRQVAHCHPSILAIFTIGKMPRRDVCSTSDEVCAEVSL